MSRTSKFVQYLRRCKEDNTLREIDRVQIEAAWEGDTLVIWASYLTWRDFRRHCYLKLKKDSGLRLVASQKLELYRIACAVTGSQSFYAKVSRKMFFARLMDCLRAKMPEMDRTTLECIAGVLLHKIKPSGGGASLTINRRWDRETLTEILRFRRHTLPVDRILNTQDLKQYLLRHIEGRQLNCRRKVTWFVLSNRHFCPYYDSPEIISALDASFKYTNSAYAFRRAMASHTELALLLPEVFFKQAGRKIRQRKFTSWLRENELELKDLKDSIEFVAEEDVAHITSWGGLEEHSRAWHAEQLLMAENLNKPDTEPFDIDPSIPRQIEESGHAFVLLETPAELRKEALKMRHCIVGYSSLIRTSEYIAYAVCDGGQERATLGITANNGRWQLDQVRRKFNADASEDLKAACQQLVSRLPPPPKRGYRGQGLLQF